ncbi:hypothetical protein DL98DRAFT_598883 [Cadophora sp. DSE1049]|nr:hypothetical protein DL98DRAFT_598883 [Cadophora sp. DSE1049]
MPTSELSQLQRSLQGLSPGKTNNRIGQRIGACCRQVSFRNVNEVNGLSKLTSGLTSDAEQTPHPAVPDAQQTLVKAARHRPDGRGWWPSQTLSRHSIQALPFMSADYSVSPPRKASAKALVMVASVSRGTDDALKAIEAVEDKAHGSAIFTACLTFSTPILRQKPGE